MSNHDGENGGERNNEAEEGDEEAEARVRSRFWTWVVASVAFRLALIYLPRNLRLSTRPEVATPLTSICRLGEGYWLKQSVMSPYTDILNAMLIRATSQSLQKAYAQHLEALDLFKLSQESDSSSSNVGNSKCRPEECYFNYTGRRCWNMTVSTY